MKKEKNCSFFPMRIGALVNLRSVEFNKRGAYISITIGWDATSNQFSDTQYWENVINEIKKSFFLNNDQFRLKDKKIIIFLDFEKNPENYEEAFTLLKNQGFDISPLTDAERVLLEQGLLVL